MSTPITLHLPEPLLHRARGLASRLGCPVDEVLVRFLESSLSPVGTGDKDWLPVENWTDEELLAAADLQMSATEDRRFSELLFKQQAKTLSGPEPGELSGLMMKYQQGQLLKAQALAEAVRRRLRESPAP